MPEVLRCWCSCFLQLVDTLDSDVVNIDPGYLRFIEENNSYYNSTKHNQKQKKIFWIHVQDWLDHFSSSSFRLFTRTNHKKKKKHFKWIRHIIPYQGKCKYLYPRNMSCQRQQQKCLPVCHLWHFLSETATQKLAHQQRDNSHKVEVS